MGASDEDLLRLLRQVEAREEMLDAAMRAAEEEDEPAARGDACPHCGEPAENLGDCHVCHEPGCLPPDVWSPGMRDPCLAVCVRCARSIHLACAAEDEAGNPRCGTCNF